MIFDHLSQLERIILHRPVALDSVPYLVNHGREGLLLPPNDVDAMVVAINRILTEQGLAGSLSQNARSKAENFSWEKILPVWMELFNNIQSHKNKVRSSRRESNVV